MNKPEGGSGGSGVPPEGLRVSFTSFERGPILDAPEPATQPCPDCELVEEPTKLGVKLTYQSTIYAPGEKWRLQRFVAKPELQHSRLGPRLHLYHVKSVMLSQASDRCACRGTRVVSSVS